jgi:hypothetical protein
MEKKAIDIKALAAYLKGMWNPNEGKALYGPGVAKAVREKGMTFVEPNWAKGDEHPVIAMSERFLKNKKQPLISSLGESLLGELISPRLLEEAAKSKAKLNTARGTLPGVIKRIKNKGFIFNQSPGEKLPSAVKGVKTNSLSSRESSVFNKIESDKIEESKHFKEIGETVRLKNIISKLKTSNPQKLHAALSRMYPDGYVAKMQDGQASLGRLGTAESTLAIPRLGYHLKDVNSQHYGNMVVQPDKQLAKNNSFLQKLQKMIFPNTERSVNKEFRVHVVNGKVVPYGVVNRGNVLQEELANSLPFRTPTRRMLENYGQSVIDNVKDPTLRKGIYGFDVGIDIHGKPQLLETNPSGTAGSSGYMAMPQAMNAVEGAVAGNLPTMQRNKRILWGGGGLLGAGAVLHSAKEAPTENTKVAKSMELKQLIKAKKMSDQSDYVHKNELIRKMLIKNPEAFKVDSHLNREYVGLTHIKSGFKIHAPKSIVPSSLMHPHIGES